jgi:hypothetical protein
MPYELYGGRPEISWSSSVVFAAKKSLWPTAILDFYGIKVAASGVGNSGKNGPH